MTSSYGRIERRAARPRTEKKSGVLQSATSRAILSMARDFHGGARGRLDVSGLLSRDGFDQAFFAALPRMLDTCEKMGFEEYRQQASDALFPALQPTGARPFGLAAFKMRLMDEAGSVSFAGVLPDGRKLEGRADLFALPLSGRLDVMEAFIEEPESLLAVTRSFKACGLAGKGSSIVVGPVLIDPWTAGDTMPGQLRMLVELLQLPLSDTDLLIGAAVSSLLGLDEGGLRTSRDVIANRMLVGVRVQVAPSGDSLEPDAFVPENRESRQGAPLWADELRKILPRGLQVSVPTTYAHATSVMGLDRILIGLIAEGHARNIDMSSGFDELHLHEDGENLLVSALKNDIALGPVTVPTTCALADAERFTNELEALSGKIVRKNARGQMLTSGHVLD